MIKKLRDAIDDISQSIKQDHNVSSVSDYLTDDEIIIEVYFDSFYLTIKQFDQLRKTANLYGLTIDRLELECGVLLIVLIDQQE